MSEQVYNEARLRDAPYIWVTWMTKLISGEASCAWSLWFRARHYSDKLETGADLSGWAAEHDALVKWRAEKLRAKGLVVRLERGLQLQGRTATISGKPDISYELDGTIYFEDCKTGKRRDSDHVQVLLYMWLFSIQNNNQLRGSVVYKDAIVEVDHNRMHDVKTLTLNLVAIVANDVAPATTPSPNECRSCNIPQFYCVDRQHSLDGELFKTELF